MSVLPPNPSDLLRAALTATTFPHRNRPILPHPHPRATSSLPTSNPLPSTQKATVAPGTFAVRRTPPSRPPSNPLPFLQKAPFARRTSFLPTPQQPPSLIARGPTLPPLVGPPPFRPPSNPRPSTQKAPPAPRDLLPSDPPITLFPQHKRLLRPLGPSPCHDLLPSDPQVTPFLHCRGLPLGPRDLLHTVTSSLLNPQQPPSLIVTSPPPPPSPSGPPPCHDLLPPDPTVTPFPHRRKPPGPRNILRVTTSSLLTPQQPLSLTAACPSSRDHITNFS